MRRGKLDAAIDAAAEIKVAFSWGVVEVKKGSLKDALRKRFPDKYDETDLTVTVENFLSWEEIR